MSEGPITRVTFSGITSILQPTAPTTVGGGFTGVNAAPPAIDIANSAKALAGQTSDTAPVSPAAVNGSQGMSFTSGNAEVNPVDLAGPQQSVVLQPGEFDQISGFDPTSDKLDLTQVLAQSHLDLSDLAQAGSFFGVTGSGGDATLSFYPNGVSAGGGSALATLIGVGSNVTLDTLISDGALKVS